MIRVKVQILPNCRAASCGANKEAQMGPARRLRIREAHTKLREEACISRSDKMVEVEQFCQCLSPRYCLRPLVLFDGRDLLKNVLTFLREVRADLNVRSYLPRRSSSGPRADVARCLGRHYEPNADVYRGDDRGVNADHSSHRIEERIACGSRIEARLDYIRVFRQEPRIAGASGR